MLNELCSKFEDFEDGQFEDFNSTRRMTEATLLSPKSLLKKCRFCNFKKRSCTLHKSSCTAIYSTCYFCNKRGHFPKSLNCKKTRKNKRKSNSSNLMLNQNWNDESSRPSLNDLGLSKERIKYPVMTNAEKIEVSSTSDLKRVKIENLSYSKRNKNINENQIEELRIYRPVEDFNILQFNVSDTNDLKLSNSESLYGGYKILQLEDFDGNSFKLPGNDTLQCDVSNARFDGFEDELTDDIVKLKKLFI